MNSEKKEALEVLSRLHAELGEYTLQAQLTNRRLELALIVISGLTTGALWTLVAGLAPTVFAWAGAILSTAATILAAYKKLMGPEEAYQQAAELYRKTGQMIADILSNPKFDSHEFWHAYKFITADKIRIDWIRGGRKGRPQYPR